MATIVFNGKTYNSVEEMPANERQAFEQLTGMFMDKNGNGIPDFLEGDIVSNVMNAVTSSVNYNGQVYSGMDELPPEVREKVQNAFDKLSQSGIVTVGAPAVSQQQPAIGREPQISRPYSPAIEEDSGSGLKWILIGAALLICLAVAAVSVYFLLAGQL
jgi:hypothetical protein